MIYVHMLIDLTIICFLINSTSLSKLEIETKSIHVFTKWETCLALALTMYNVVFTL